MAKMIPADLRPWLKLKAGSSNPGAWENPENARQEAQSLMDKTTALWHYAQKRWGSVPGHGPKIVGAAEALANEFADLWLAILKRDKELGIYSNGPSDEGVGQMRNLLRNIEEAKRPDVGAMRAKIRKGEQELKLPTANLPSEDSIWDAPEEYAGPLQRVLDLQDKIRALLDEYRKVDL